MTMQMDLVLADKQYETQIRTQEDFRSHTLKILEWIRGPGEKLLYSQKGIPRSFQEADNIRKAHEQFEFKCMQALSVYAQLIDIGRNEERPIAELDGLDAAVQDFLNKLKMRRTVVVSFYTFYRILNELDNTVNELNRLCREEDHNLVSTETLQSVESKLATLKSQSKSLENQFASLSHEVDRLRPLTLNSGSNQGQQLTTPMSGEVSREIELTLKSARDRVTDTLQLAHLTQLRLQKVEKMVRVEWDANQAVDWLGEMSGLLVKAYLERCIGITPVETSSLLSDHRKLQEKAKETYSFYQNALVAFQAMCRANHCPADRASALMGRAEDAWNRLNGVSKEIRERMEVGGTLYQNIDLILGNVERVILAISRELDSGMAVDKVRANHLSERDEIVRDFENSKEIGFALIHRIKTRIGNEIELNDVYKIDETQIVIKMKLYTLWIKILELDYFLGKRVRHGADFEDIVILIKIQFDKFYERMNFHKSQWSQVGLAIYLDPAEAALRIHADARTEIQGMWDRIKADLDPIAAGGSQHHEETVKAAKEALTQANQQRGEWDREWTVHQGRLKQRRDILARFQEIKLHLEDWWARLIELRNRQPIDSIRVVEEINAGIMQLRERVPENERAINAVLEEIWTEVGAPLEEERNTVKRSWEKYKKHLELLRVMIDIVYQIDVFLPRLDTFQTSLPDRMDRARTPKDQAQLADEVSEVVSTIRAFEVDRMLENCATINNGDDSPARQLADRLRLYLDWLNELQFAKNVRPDASGIAKQLRFVVDGDLANVTASVSDRCQLECRFEGFENEADGLPEVLWLKDNERLTEGPPRIEQSLGRSAARLVIKRTEERDHGVYKCIIRDPRNGVQIQSQARLTVSSSPQFQRGLESLSVLEYDPVLLQCQLVPGLGHTEVTWTHDQGPLLSGVQVDNRDGVCAIMIDKVKPVHAGKYTCTAKSSSGKSSTSATLTVNESRYPTMTSQLDPKYEISEGTQMLLTVTYDAAPTPEITWYKDNRTITPTSRISVKNLPRRSCLSIDDVRDSDAGIYSVVVKNSLGSDKSTADVRIGPSPDSTAPVFATPPADAHVREGDSATLSCRVVGHPKPAVHWNKAGKEIFTNRDFTVKSDEPMGWYSLKIGQAYLEDSGEYTILAENRNGRSQTKCMLKVEPLNEAPTPRAPFVEDGLKDQCLQTGNNLHLSAVVGGHPTPNVKWFRDNELLKSSDHIKISQVDREHHLDIYNFQPSDAGIYRIKASNDLGHVDLAAPVTVLTPKDDDSKRTNLIFHNTVVRSPPEFHRLFGDEVCKPGSTVILSCELTGLPKPTVWWSYNGIFLENSPRHQFVANEDTYSLVIPNIRDEDAGRYSVTGENSSGVATCSSLVMVEEPKSNTRYPRSNASLSLSRCSSRPLSPVAAHSLLSHGSLSQTYQGAGHKFDGLYDLQVTPRFNGKSDSAYSTLAQPQSPRSKGGFIVPDSPGSPALSTRFKLPDLDSLPKIDTTDFKINKTPVPAAGVVILREDPAKEKPQDGSRLKTISVKTPLQIDMTDAFPTKTSPAQNETIPLTTTSVKKPMDIDLMDAFPKRASTTPKDIVPSTKKPLDIDLQDVFSKNISVPRKDTTPSKTISITKSFETAAVNDSSTTKVSTEREIVIKKTSEDKKKPMDSMKEFFSNDDSKEVKPQTQIIPPTVSVSNEDPKSSSFIIETETPKLAPPGRLSGKLDDILGLGHISLNSDVKQAETVSSKPDKSPSSLPFDISSIFSKKTSSETTSRKVMIVRETNDGSSGVIHSKTATEKHSFHSYAESSDFDSG